MIDTANNSKPKISIVSPVYMAEKIIPELISRINEAVWKITDNFEIILVEDGGSDKSWEVINEQTRNNKNLIGIKLSRNFGQHYAITAGLDQAVGEWIVLLDCDLQDQPEEIPFLYKTALTGYDAVMARRTSRRDSLIKMLFSRLFYRLLSFLSGTDFDPLVANFGIYHRKIINTFCQMREPIRVFPVMVKWIGFKTCTINVLHAKRSEGKSSYSIKRLLNLALDIILAYSDKPLRIIIGTGVILSLTSFLFALITLSRYFLGYIKVSGYTSLIISIWFLSGILLMTLGVIGLYIGKIFDGVKQRPIYIIDKVIKST